MDPAEAFCSQLLDEGRVVFTASPSALEHRPEGAIACMARAFQTFRLSVAGAPIAFDPQVAWEAAELLRQACWALVCHDEPPERLKLRLALSRPLKTAAQHLSADLMLRYLPQVHRRAHALGPSDPLVRILGDVLRRCPLSGVLADIREGPATPLEFGGHDGLMLLYAERLARHVKPAWVPQGRVAEFAELVFREQGRELPDLPRITEEALQDVG